MPGFDEAYADAQNMKRMRLFFVVCDFVPPDLELSRDPQVQRIRGEDQEAVFKNQGYEAGAGYIVLSLKSQSTGKLVVEVSNMYGMLARHGYEFEFRRTESGLRASGNMQWIS
jgi:hypothetical protein